MDTFDSLTNTELRKKLLDFGLNVAVTDQNHFLLVGKLKSLTAEGHKEKERRKTVESSSSAGGAGDMDAESHSSKTAVAGKSRLSLNDQALKKRPSSMKQVSNTTTSTVTTTGGRASSLTRRSNVKISAPTKPTISEKNGNDSDDDMDLESMSVPAVSFFRPPPSPPRFLSPRTTDAGSSSGTYSRLQFRETPKSLADPTSQSEAIDRQQRFTNYLNLFREDNSGSSGSSRARATTAGRHTTYSDDESDEEPEAVSPSKLGKVRTMLSPTSWFKASNSNIRQPVIPSAPPVLPPQNTIHSSHLRGSTHVGFNNGHSGNRNILGRTKKYLGGMFEQKANGSRRETGVPSDGSPNISKYLVLILVLFFVVVGILYINKKASPRSHLPPAAEKASVSNKRTGSTAGNYPICGMEGVSNTACIEKGKLKRCRSLFNQLRDELIQRAKRKGCDTKDSHVTLDVAKNLLYMLSEPEFNKREIDEVYREVLLLCTENPKWGLQIESSQDKVVQSSSDIAYLGFHEATISAKGVAPYLVCQLWSGLYWVIYYFSMFVVLVASLYAVVTVWKYVQRKKIKEQNEVFDLVEQILDLLYQQYEKSKETGTDAFLAVNHIRDEMVPPKEKQSKAALWNKAVNYISENESRIREEIQHISGEEFQVWRWLPGASPLTSQRKSLSANSSSPHSPNVSSCSSNNSSVNKWQGQAFEMSDNGPNSIPVTPTSCLKIRHMWEQNSGSPDQILAKVERAIREKCPSSSIQHVGIDPNASDGCVYVKCATNNDARAVYFDLHGWWFEGNLLSVKFLREERYVTRFPKWYKGITIDSRA